MLILELSNVRRHDQFCFDGFTDNDFLFKGNRQVANGCWVALDHGPAHDACCCIGKVHAFMNGNYEL